MATDRLEELAQRAEAATPGRWRRHGWGIQAVGRVDTYDGPVWGRIATAETLAETDAGGRCWTTGGTRDANAAYIAAANPAVVLALVRALQAADRLADAVAEHPIHIVPSFIPSSPDEPLCSICRRRHGQEG